MPLREFIKLLAKEEPADHSLGVGGKSFDSPRLVRGTGAQSREEMAGWGGGGVDLGRRLSLHVEV